MENLTVKDSQKIDNSSNHLKNFSGKGELSINGSLNISGVYSGKININECLVVGKEAVLIGEFKVKDLIVFGKVIGKVYVSNLAELHEGSKISGTLIAKEIKKHSDSFIYGHHIIDDPSRFIAQARKTGT